MTPASAAMWGGPEFGAHALLQEDGNFHTIHVVIKLTCDTVLLRVACCNGGLCLHRTPASYLILAFFM